MLSWGREDSDVIFATARRLYEEVAPQGIEEWGPALARLPWNMEETQVHVQHRYREDEAEFLQRLEMVDSHACRIHAKLRLGRAVIKHAMRSLKHTRIRQVTLGSIICATRFRHYDPSGVLLPTFCSVCRAAPDTLEHLLECTGLT